MCDVGMSDSYNFSTIKLILELSFKLTQCCAQSISSYSMYN